MAEKKVIHVDDIDLTQRTSAFNEPEDAGTEAVCYLGGKPVGEGSIMCFRHTEYVCTKFGTWQSTGQKC
jgi:hypothetical protein